MIKDQPASIALIEDDPILREEIAHFLRSAGFVVHAINNGISLDELLIEYRVDALILDINLPGQSGFDIASRIRQHSPQIGIVILTARTALPDRLRAYEAGADIFLPKPTPPQELLAAIHSIIRRLSVQPVAAWMLDGQRRLLYSMHQPEPASLTAAETVLLIALSRAPNQTLETDAICLLLSQRGTVLAAEAETITKRALENLVSRLRKKIAAVQQDTSSPSIQSVWGLGYQLALSITIRQREF